MSPAELSLADLYPRERFLDFIPSSVRERLGDDLEVPVISSALLAEHQHGLSGPVIELVWPGTAALLGVLRAAKAADAIVCVRTPPGADNKLVDAVVSVAEVARFDRPLVVVATLEGEVDAETRAFREIDAGFSAVSLNVASLGLEDDVDRAVALVRPLSERGIGVELDLRGTRFPGLFLAHLDEAEVALAAVRGASVDDEIGDAFVVVDPVEDEVPSDAALRISTSGFLVRALSRVMPIKERIALRADVVSFGADEALSMRLAAFGLFTDDERGRLEALCRAELAEAIPHLSADRVASDLLDELG